MEREEIRESLDARINRAKEKEKMMISQKRGLQSKVTIPIPKKMKPSIHEGQEISRIRYIEQYCLNLMINKKFAKESVDIIAQCMIEKNIKMDKYLIEDDRVEYSYTVYLVYMMILSGLFNEDDYYDAAEYIIENAFDVKTVFEELVKQKKETI